MERKCSSCGARISDGMKICANCGKVVEPLNRQPQRRTSPKGAVQRQTVPRSRPAPNRGAVDTRRAPERRSVQNERHQNVNHEMPQRNQRQEIPQQRNPRQHIPQQKSVHEKPRKANVKREKDKRSIGKYIKIATVILIIYAVISVVQIFRVRLSAYDFKTEMKMTYSNYGQAADHFFESSFWFYNPFTCTVRLSGTASNGDKYLIKYSALTSVNVKSITVNDEEKSEKQVETEIMGLFI